MILPRPAPSRPVCCIYQRPTPLGRRATHVCATALRVDRHGQREIHGVDATGLQTEDSAAARPRNGLRVSGGALVFVFPFFSFPLFSSVTTAGQAASTFFNQKTSADAELLQHVPGRWWKVWRTAVVTTTVLRLFFSRKVCSCARGKSFSGSFIRPPSIFRLRASDREPCGCALARRNPGRWSLQEWNGRAQGKISGVGNKS